MKKFQYSLETVLNYKNQVYESWKEEYAEASQAVTLQKQKITALNAEREQIAKDFEEVKRQGATIDGFQLHLRMLEDEDHRILEATTRLKALEQRAEKRKKALIEAHIDVNKFEKLRDKKRAAYQKEVQKDNEAFIEEFVSNQQGRAALAQG